MSMDFMVAEWDQLHGHTWQSSIGFNAANSNMGAWLRKTSEYLGVLLEDNEHALDHCNKEIERSIEAGMNIDYVSYSVPEMADVAILNKQFTAACDAIDGLLVGNDVPADTVLDMLVYAGTNPDLDCRERWYVAKAQAEILRRFTDDDTINDDLVCYVV